MLTGCIDQSNDNSSVLKNALIAIFQVGIAAIVGLQLEQVLA
ncbi:hypothetical protein [Francisella uliginis]|nr:hypothetical protein [Francisella uliginis]